MSVKPLRQRRAHAVGVAVKRRGRLIRRIAEAVVWNQRSAGPPFDRDLVGRRYRWSHPTNQAASQISQTWV